MRYDVEIVTAEDGGEATVNYLSRSEVVRLVNQMKDGDALVINAHDEPSGAL